MKQIVSVEIINKKTKYRTEKQKQGDIVGGGFDSEFNYISTYSAIMKDVQVPYLVYTFRVRYSNGVVKDVTCKQGTAKFNELMGFYERQQQVLEEQQEFERRQQQAMQQQAIQQQQAAVAAQSQPQQQPTAPKPAESAVPGSKPVAMGMYKIGVDFPAGTFNFWTEDPEEKFGGVCVKDTETEEELFFTGYLHKGDTCRAILEEGQLLTITGKGMYAAKAEPVTFD
ncbi:MAG: hypothetical protein K6B15_02765 [Parasporobacterium sp.]|nr:hypothetical protein [Parasporobacterium sp.]